MNTDEFDALTEDEQIAWLREQAGKLHDVMRGHSFKGNCYAIGVAIAEAVHHEEQIDGALALVIQMAKAAVIDRLDPHLEAPCPEA